jgi:hypothetical protein
LTGDKIGKGRNGEIAMKVKNMTGEDGRAIPNQFIIIDVVNEMSGNAIEYFQSYNSIIVKRDCFRADVKGRQVWLDEKYWDYSKTTGKYRNQFLNESIKETRAKIKSGEYILTNLN